MNLFRATAVALALSLGVVSCTNGQIDPQKVQDSLKTTCGILIVGASLTALINAAVGMTVQAIVDAVCSAYKAQVASEARTGSRATSGVVHVPVVINGKTIDVEVTPQ